MTLWVKLWTDILDDPKLIRACREGAQHLVLLPWLLAFAKRADDDGRLTVNGFPAEPEDIARSIPGTSPRKVAASLAELEAIGVLKVDSSGARFFASWEVRAGKPSDSKEAIAERVRQHRERQRQVRMLATNDGNALQGVTRNAVEQEGESKTKKQSLETDFDSAPTTGSILPSRAALLLELIDENKRPAVHRQMVQILHGGAYFRGGRVAATAARLDEKCAETLARLSTHQVKNAWAYTLTKLADVSDDSPTERAAESERRERDSDEAIRREQFARAGEWAKRHPSVETEARRSAGDRLDIGHEILYQAALVGAYRRSGQSDGSGIGENHGAV